VGALEHQGLGEMLGPRIGEAIPEIKPGRVPIERAGRSLTWSAEKLSSGNFLDFSFLQSRAGPIQQEAVRPEGLKAEKLPAGNLADRYSSWRR
jgi:hypothetical protein